VVLLLFASGLEHGLSSLRQGGLMGLMAAVAGAVVPYVIVFEYAVNAGFNPGAASLIALTTAPNQPGCCGWGCGEGGVAEAPKYRRVNSSRISG
jgi:hypothetical protein